MTPSSSIASAQEAFAAYENVRQRLPSACFPQVSVGVRNLKSVSDRFDVFLLDAFGVLNIGESAIPGAVERIRQFQEAGKMVLVVSNAAGYPKRLLLEKYSQFGFCLEPQNVVTSREVILAALESRDNARLGLMASQAFGLEELEHLDIVFLEDDADTFDSVDEFVLIGAAEWTARRQALLEASLRSNPRPVLVGNPDIVAPRETGLSYEPGYFAHQLANATGLSPEFFGKPFSNIFDMVTNRISTCFDKDRIVMVGDTLHTDILGGRNAGLKTALVTQHGALKGMDVGAAIKRSGIVPDFVVSTT